MANVRSFVCVQAVAAGRAVVQFAMQDGGGPSVCLFVQYSVQSTCGY